MKIIFPHIPKCAGGSIKSQLKKREDVFLDYFNHPTWIYQPDKELGEMKQIELKEKIRKIDSWIVYGHFAPCIYFELPYDLVIIILRDPLERAVSHYHYVKQRLPDNNITRKRHKEVGPIKENRMSIDEFVELDHIKYFYSKYYLRNIVPNKNFIILSMHDMKFVCRKIFEKTNINLDYTIRLNRSRYDGNFGYLQDVFQTDTELYNCLTQSFP
jgi:hypothetical protein